MSILSFIKTWKDFSTIWAIIQPFILKLIKKKVPTTITKLYENLAKYTQPAIDSLFKLKGKIQNSPNELDDYCFNQGVNAIESFANYLLETVKTLRALGNTLTGIQNIFVAMGRVFELFDLKPEITDCKNPITLRGLNKDIKL